MGSDRLERRLTDGKGARDHELTAYHGSYGVSGCRCAGPSEQPRDDQYGGRDDHTQRCRLRSAHGTLLCMEPGRARNAVSQLRKGTLEYCVLAC
jgi:hypothetical protein